MDNFIVEPPLPDGFGDSQQQDYSRPPMNPKVQMIGNLQSLKDDYLLKGGEDPEFINKV